MSTGGRGREFVSITFCSDFYAILLPTTQEIHHTHMYTCTHGGATHAGLHSLHVLGKKNGGVSFSGIYDFNTK